MSRGKLGCGRGSVTKKKFHGSRSKEVAVEKEKSSVVEDVMYRWTRNPAGRKKSKKCPIGGREKGEK